MEKEMEKEKNTIMRVNQNLKENIQMEKNGMERELNVMMVNYILKENI